MFDASYATTHKLKLTWSHPPVFLAQTESKQSAPLGFYWQWSQSQSSQRYSQDRSSRCCRNTQGSFRELYNNTRKTRGTKTQWQWIHLNQIKYSKHTKYNILKITVSHLTSLDLQQTFQVKQIKLSFSCFCLCQTCCLSKTLSTDKECIGWIKMIRYIYTQHKCWQIRL